MSWVYKNELSSVIFHSGIKGQKWGRRRYQNNDGTYTEEGKLSRRKNRDLTEMDLSGMSDKDMQDKIKRKNLEKQYRKFFDPINERNEAYNREKGRLESGQALATRTRSITNDLRVINRATQPIEDKRKRMDLSNMTDKELREKINRELLERQYENVFNPPQVKKGRIYADRTLEVAGAVVGIAGSSLGIALAIKELRK